MCVSKAFGSLEWGFCTFLYMLAWIFFLSSASLVLVGRNNFILKEVSAKLARRMYLLQLYLLPVVSLYYCGNLSAGDFIPIFECKDG